MRQPHRVGLSGVREEVAGLVCPPAGARPPSPRHSPYWEHRSPRRSCSRGRCGRPAWPGHRSGCPAEPATKRSGTPVTTGQLPRHESSQQHPRNSIWEPPAPCSNRHPVGSAAAGCPVWGLGEQGRGNRDSLEQGMVGLEEGYKGSRAQGGSLAQDPAPLGCGALWGQSQAGEGTER